MPGKAATTGSLTAHGGIVIGPGNNTVLINGKPATCTGDQHTCPACTPNPHVGGPIVGPGVPNVLIGGRPAATVNDLCLCANCPSHIVTGSPNVLIGTNGSAGPSDISKFLSPQAQTIQAHETGEVKPVESIGELPLKDQAEIQQPSEDPDKRQLSQSSNNHQQKRTDTKKITIRDIVSILKDVEKRSGYQAALHSARYLDYSALCDMTKAYVREENTNPDNDPNIMPTRFMILYGADDNMLSEIDSHYDSPSHKITVSNLRKALQAVDSTVQEKGPYDDYLYSSYYQCTKQLFRRINEKEHVVKEDENLGKIADKSGLTLTSVYECNKGVIGDNPDILKPGTKLYFPHYDFSTIDEMIRNCGGDPAKLTKGFSYVYPWVIFSVTLSNKDGSIYMEKRENGEKRIEFKEKKKFEVKHEKTGALLASGEISRSDELSVLVPDVKEKQLFVDGDEYETWNGGANLLGQTTSRFVRIGKSPEFTADFVIDGHSHIQSGATAPLPLLWDQISQKVKGVKVSPTRSYLDTLGSVFLGKGGNVQRKKTEEIADDLVSELKSTYTKSKLLEEKPYGDGLSVKDKKDKGSQGEAPIFSPAIIMPMDMDYAHIAGFPPESSTIYHEGKFTKWVSTGSVGTCHGDTFPSTIETTVEGVYYYERKDALLRENKGTIVDVSHEKPEKGWLFQAYKKQYENTIAAIQKNPWVLIPMFHYDPRRWYKQSGSRVDPDNWKTGPWDFPFKYIATLKKTGVFIGFKMYPPLGYKPLDLRLPCLANFYARCETEGIPILAHCSPGGMTTHEAKFYHAFDKADLTIQPTRIVSCTYDPCTPLGYFFDEYVHPKNWRPVLMKFPKLKLCLAHLGGREWNEDEMGSGIASDWVEEIINLCDPKIVQGKNSQGKDIRFENVYTDLSCYNLGRESIKKNIAELFKEMKKNRRFLHLKDKVLFGVDWYLSLITKAPDYREYVEGFFDTMSEFDKWQWYRSALVNSATFYGLDNSALLKNMNKALEDVTSDSSKRISGYNRIKTIKQQVETIRKELNKKHEENK